MSKLTKLYDLTKWPKQGFEIADYPFIGTVDAAPKIGKVLDVAGQKFSAVILDVKEGAAGVRPFAAELNTRLKANEFERNIICPYCGHVDRDSFERSDEDTVECDVCGGTIHYERIVTVEYTTEPVKPPVAIRARWVLERGTSE